MAKRIAISLFALSLLVACGSDTPPPTQGYIRQRTYTPAHWEGGYRTETQFGYSCGIQYTGKYGCGLGPHTVQVWEDQHEFIADSWKLFLEDCHADKDGKQKCNTGWINVDETDYHNFNLGQHYPTAQ